MFLFYIYQFHKFIFLTIFHFYCTFINCLIKLNIFSKNSVFYNFESFQFNKLANFYENKILDNIFNKISF